VDVLSSRILLRLATRIAAAASTATDILGLAIYQESGPPDDPRLVFFPGQRLLERPARPDAR
jgi:hypothetical protein